jgi:isopenicillin N synthase-like dioxygenase
MASSKLFEGIPPFPDDIPTVSMNTVSLAGLRENDTQTAEQVLAACKELGFFFLDLRRDSMGDAMIECIDQLFSIGQEIFDLPESVKHQYLHDIPRSFLGYACVLAILSNKLLQRAS